MVWGVVRIVLIVLGSAIVFLFMVQVLTALIKFILVAFSLLLREWIVLA